MNKKLLSTIKRLLLVKNNNNTIIIVWFIFYILNIYELTYLYLNAYVIY